MSLLLELSMLLTGHELVEKDGVIESNISNMIGQEDSFGLSRV